MHCRSFPQLILAAFLLCACHSAPTPPVLTWAIAIHGGAGTMDANAPAEQQRAYEQALMNALVAGRDLLAKGGTALDVCEHVVRLLEDDPLFNAGVGAVFDENGEHELDAAIMDGDTMRCGGVAGVRTVRHPVTLARHVMTDTRHVLLCGAGADKFAEQAGVERCDNKAFDTDARRRSWEQLMKERARTGMAAPSDRRNDYGTVGCVVRDRDGRLAAATSTGGMTGKRQGRIGDSPIPGAGTYADQSAAISCTGTGEQFIRHAIARSVTARMQFAGQTLEQAAHAEVFGTLDKDDGGLIAVDRAGRMVGIFNTNGMYRGFADSLGRFEVRIFAD